MSEKREYLTTEKNDSFDFESKIPSKVKLSELFQEVTRRLSKKLDIDRGVFIIRDKNNDKFSVISTWNNGKVRNNISINISVEPSLIEKVAEGGICFSETYTGKFSGNFFERKLLLGVNSQAYVLQPLKHEGKVVGMLGFSSLTPTAFSTVEEGILNKIAEKLGEVITNKTMN